MSFFTAHAKLSSPDLQTMCTSPDNVAPPDSSLRSQRTARLVETAQSATRAHVYAISVPLINQQALDPANRRQIAVDRPARFERQAWAMTGGPSQ
jgi:hypothetical protein